MSADQSRTVATGFAFRAEASKEAENFAELQGLDKRDAAIAILRGNLKRSLKFR